MKKFPRRALLLRLILCGLLEFVLVPKAAFALEAESAWSRSNQSSIRLISGGEVESGVWRAGVEIRLAPGYKTYWRNPGDSGIPPRFDWSESQNMASVEVKWPAPERFSDGNGSSIGYAKTVIFPIVIRAIDAARPVMLKLRLDYAVCETLCIPAIGEATLEPVVNSPRHMATISNAQAKVPVRLTNGASADMPAVLSATTLISNGKLMLDLTLRMPESAQAKDVLIEGPDMWVIGKSVISVKPNDHSANPSGDQLRVVAAIEDRPKTQNGITPLLITILSSIAPVEIALDLEIPPLTP